jgi:hypothetical protein
VLKGEAVVMVDVGRSVSDDLDESGEQLLSQARATAIRGFAAGKTLKDLLKELGGLGLSRSDLYQLLLSVKDGKIRPE